MNKFNKEDVVVLRANPTSKSGLVKSFVGNLVQVEWLNGTASTHLEEELDIIRLESQMNNTTSEPELNDGNKYHKTIIGLCGTAVKVDVYRVLDAYPTGDAALDHAIKKALIPGKRGHKDKITDYQNIIESAQKALTLVKQKQALGIEV